MAAVIRPTATGMAQVIDMTGEPECLDTRFISDMLKQYHETQSVVHIPTSEELCALRLPLTQDAKIGRAHV